MHFDLLADLVPSANVEKWLKHLRNEFPTVAFKASTQLQRQNLVLQLSVNCMQGVIYYVMVPVCWD